MTSFVAFSFVPFLRGKDNINNNDNSKKDNINYYHDPLLSFFLDCQSVFTNNKNNDNNKTKTKKTPTFVPASVLLISVLLLTNFVGSGVKLEWYANSQQQQQQQQKDLIYHHIIGKAQKEIGDNKENLLSLRLDYTNLERLSPLAKQMEQHVQNCSLPQAYVIPRNIFGLGSDLHLWGQALCNSISRQHRLRTIGPWIWNDMEQCNNDTWAVNGSSISCYFLQAEIDCPNDNNNSVNNDMTDVATALRDSTNSNYDDDNNNEDDKNNNNSNRTLSQQLIHQQFQSLELYLTKVKFPRLSKTEIYSRLHEGDSDFMRQKYPSLLSLQKGYIYHDCKDIISFDNRHLIREAGIEFLFTRISPILLQEAQRQLNLVFSSSHVPQDLIVVHIRWGDKKLENKLLGIEQYMNAIASIIHKRLTNNNNDKTTITNTTIVSDAINNDNDINKNDNENGDNNNQNGTLNLFKYPEIRNYPAHVYLATEDPHAVEQFQKYKPDAWTLYIDQFYVETASQRVKTRQNHVPQLSKQTNGKVGLWTLGSLLVAMEGQDYVLTLGSNWSRVMNEIRKTIIDPRCNGCTSLINLETERKVSKKIY